MKAAPCLISKDGLIEALVRRMLATDRLKAQRS